MKRVALTGGIATGKSYVAGQLRAAGVPVVDADVLAREVVAPGTAALARVRTRFGAEVLAKDGSLNRLRMADIVFKDARKRRELEAIIHPAVQLAVDRFFAGLPANTPFAVADIPLVFETGKEKEFDAIVVASCPRAMQIERVMARNRLTRDQADRRLAAQLPIDHKVARADFVIRTDGTFEDTDGQVRNLLVELKRLKKNTTPRRPT